MSKKKRKMRILKQSHSAEKAERGDLQNFKKLEGGPFGDKKIFEKKVAQCRNKFKGGTL